MSNSFERFKRPLIAACFVLLFGLAGCSSDSSTSSSSNSNALPQPIVDCNGSSCID